MLTFGLQIDVMIWVSLRVVHELPHDDGKAKDVTFGRSIDWETDLSQKFGGCPVHLYKKKQLIASSHWDTKHFDFNSSTYKPS